VIDRACPAARSSIGAIVHACGHVRIEEQPFSRAAAQQSLWHLRSVG
jgi:hypothetical protein